MRISMTPSISECQSLIEALEPAVRAAGAAIMKIHAAGVTARHKADGSPVTDADEAAEAILLAALAKVAPQIPVVSEENAESHHMDAPELFFLVDPIDGTKEFMRPNGAGAFTVNIGLVAGGRAMAGIVFAPALDRYFAGVVGAGAIECCAGQTGPITVRDVPVDGPTAVASRSHRDPTTDGWLDRHGISQTVATGSSVKFCLLAAGEADAYPRFAPTMEWDTAAGEAVLRAAGGIVETPEGDVFTYGKPGYRNGSFIALGGMRLR